MAKKKGLYAEIIPAKPKALATKNPVGSPDPVGKFRSPTVPKKAGQLHGLGSPLEPFHEHQVKGSHGFGHIGTQKHGHLRLSGYADAHRLGAKVIGKFRKAPETSK